MHTEGNVKKDEHIHLCHHMHAVHVHAGAPARDDGSGPERGGQHGASQVHAAHAQRVRVQPRVPAPAMPAPQMKQLADLCWNAAFVRQLQLPSQRQSSRLPLPRT